MGVYLNAVNDPPVNQLNNDEEAPPQISVVGTEITASPGSWNDKIDTDISLTAANITFSYQWQRNSINCTDGLYYNECNGEDGSFLTGNSCGDSSECQILEEDWVDIIGENLETYEIKNIDAQKYIRIEVTATDDGVGLPSQQSTIAFSEFHYVDNSAPIPQNIGYNIYEDTVLTEDAPGILVNDSDPDDDAISAEVVVYPENGEVNLNLNGSFVYTPNENFNGVDQFEYKIYDGALYGNDNAIVTITVSPVNDIPIFTSGGNVESSENLGNVDMFAWASNISDGDPEATQALEFTLTALNPDLFEVQPTVDPVSGTLSFAVYDNLNGNSDVTISLKDNGGLENEGVDETELSQFNLNIIPINDSPTFTPGDTITVLEDSGEYSEFSWATNIDDGDAELVQTLSFSIISNDNSLLFTILPTIDENGKITFTLDDNKSGVAELIISLLDDGSSISPNSNSSAEITLIINVTPVNDIPQWTIGKGIEVLEDAGSQNVLNYVTAIDDGDPEVTQVLTFNLIDVTNASLFAETPSIDATGTLTYLINEDINGSSLVYFTLSDDGGTDNGGVNQTSQQFFEIEVLAVNDAPTFGIDELGELAEDDFSVAEIIVTPEIPPNDEGNQSVQYSLSSLEAVNENGALFANLQIESATGNVTINPIANGNGQAVFTIVANDGSGTENGGAEIFEQNFTYIVNAINDPPVNVELPIIGGNAYIDSLLTVSNGVWNDDLDTLFSGTSEITYEYRWQRADDINETNIEYISDAVFNEYEVTQEDFHKFLRVKIIASDDGPRDNHEGLSTTEHSEFSEILNTPPVAVDDNYSINEDLTLIIDFELGLLKGWNQGDVCIRFGDEYDSDCDRDGDPLVVSLASPVSFGDLSLNDDGSFTYTPDTNKNEINLNITDNIEIDQFTYTISDGESASSPARVIIVINPVNDAPIFELTNSINEVISSVDVYEDFATQQVLVSLGLIPTDETGQEVEYIISPESISTADISINAETGEVTIQSVANLYSITEFTITATDNGGVALDGIDNYTQNFTLNITSVNDVPSFVKGEDEPILEDAGLISKPWATNISRGPADETPQELTFSITTDNDGFFETYPIVDGNTGVLTYQIADDLNGEVEIALTLKDNGGTEFGGVDESEQQTFNIYVEAVNDAPSFVLGPNSDLEINEDGFENSSGLLKSVSSWTTDISKGPIDEAADILTFNITSSESDATIFSEFPKIDEESGEIEYTINPEYNGKAVFTVNLSDDGGIEYGGDSISVDKTFTIWVRQINDIPKPFKIHPRIFDYAKDTTTFYFDIDASNDTTDIFYRLPYQVFAPPEQPDSLLRFAWEHIDLLDV
ncbi:MAG: tandem-95 repeat protein, partial [Candidatus Marinimicrobia bacterium]|nr:tandem-95 repeat protein [Candidatus Neomarinimicrobiota bacterium]